MFDLAGIFGALGSSSAMGGAETKGMTVGGMDANALSAGGEIHNLGNSMTKARLGQMNALTSSYGMPDLKHDGSQNYAANMARKNEALLMQQEADKHRVSAEKRYNTQTDYLKALTDNLSQSRGMQADTLQALMGSR